LAGLKHGHLRDIDVERVLSAVRAHILLHLPSDRLRDRHLARLLEALTHQVHLNGFVWATSDAEAQRLGDLVGDVWNMPAETLAHRFDSIALRDPHDAVRLALYLPVTALAVPASNRGRNRFERCTPWLQACRAALSAKLQRETAIAGQQRWFMADELTRADDAAVMRGAAPANSGTQRPNSQRPNTQRPNTQRFGAVSGSKQRDATISLQEPIAFQQPSSGSGLRELARLLAPAKLDLGKSSTRVLVTGVGTMDRPLRAAARYGPRVHVDVVDQDPVALARLQRRLEETGSDGQVSCWRTDAGALRRVGTGAQQAGAARYDVIESIDWLGQERAPLETWERLMELLRPGGFALIGVPSRRAREAVLDLAFDDAYPADLQDNRAICAFRQELFARPPGDDPAFARHPDIWTLGSFKRYALPKEEHPFDLTMVASALPRVRARFVGLQTTRACETAFKRFVGAQKQAGIRYTDELSKWAAFDAAHPAYMSGGYTFWVQKRGG
ncbi:MAG: class I SAM-dependent methyltransferase, partial [Pseudomonadota bacterium]